MSKNESGSVFNRAAVALNRQAVQQSERKEDVKNGDSPLKTVKSPEDKWFERSHDGCVQAEVVPVKEVEFLENPDEESLPQPAVD